MSKKGQGFKKPKLKQSARFKIKDEAERIDYDNLKPIFSLKHMQYGGESCISNCDNNDRSAILDRMLRLSQFRWKDIISQSRKGNGYELMKS